VVSAELVNIDEETDAKGEPEFGFVVFVSNAKVVVDIEELVVVLPVELCVI